MKKVFKSMRLFISMFLLGCSFSFVACSNDDETAPELPNEVTTEVMFGDYAGKMVAYSIVPSEGEDTGEGEDKPVGVDVSVKVNNDTVYFEKFPIKDIVLSIVKDETLADKIVEAVGDVSYKVGYAPTLTTAKDSIQFVLDPKPLKLSLVVPSATEGEDPQTLLVEVKVKAGESAGYVLESANMKFNFAATEVLLGEGEGQTSLPGFNVTTFNFDMNQNKIGHLRF